MKKTLFVLLFALLFGLGSAAQRWSESSFLEWSEKEVRSILRNSPWQKTQRIQILDRTSFPARDQPSEGSGTTEVTLPEFGGDSDWQGVTYSISFLSALPVRQALARWSMLQGSFNSEEAMAFVGQEVFSEHVVVAVAVESGGGDYREFLEISSAELQDSVYLELKADGRKIYLQKYLKPDESINGRPLFFFPRHRDGQELIRLEDKQVKFVAPISQDVRLQRSFPLRKMTYRGELAL